jgi:hypothetical protein
MRSISLAYPLICVPLFACGNGPVSTRDPNPPASSNSGGGGAEGAGGGSSGTGGSGGAGTIGLSDAATTDPGPGSPACNTSGQSDADGDGYTVADGDCNDCDSSINPGAFDVPNNHVDEDCSGTPDDEPAACDDGLPDDGDATALAKAMGICRTAVAGAKGKDRTWGLLSARFVFPDGTTASLDLNENDGATCADKGAVPNDLSHGILKRFGPSVKPRQGAAFSAISSGIAREGVHPLPDQPDVMSPDGATMCRKAHTPPGFPVSSYATCGDLDESLEPAPEIRNVAYDGMALELVVRAPTNAKSFAFDFDFYTFEYEEYVCSPFNDAFVALLFSKSPDVPADHNIAFDSQKNPVCVNNGFVEVCEPWTYESTRNGMPFQRPFTCKYGTKELADTGFDDGENHAATGWLETHSNVVPGEELTLRFAIWDAGDDVLDSTVLLDHFTWDLKPGTTVTVRPPDIK